MARKTKEEKIMEHGKRVAEDLLGLYNKEARAVVEYNKLLTEYHKLIKRFNKIISINDAVSKDFIVNNAVSKDVIVNNESLKDSVDYTIKTAREKLLHNVAEHRKTKDILAKNMQSDKNKDKVLEKKLEQAYIKISKLEIELENTKRNIDDNSQNLLKKRNEQDRTLEINLPQFKNFSYEELLEQEIKKSNLNKTPLFIAKLTIDNFKKIKISIEEHGNISTFLRGTTKYLFVTLGNEHIIFYSHHNVYYLVFKNLNKEQAKAKIDIANIKRKLNNITITFSIGATQYIIDEDTFESINIRCDEANEEASIENNESSFVVK
ncbi:hypothetical protein DZA35_02145 [Arcobacter sp. HD9-500m-PIT-SAG03]|nr:hypothetical protein DZA35_02145 [Arcobacter sp. HD9-500m-PIT-SAG03]